MLLLLPFVVLELALRAFGIGGSVIYEENPAYGYRPKPCQRFSTLGTPITILSNGFRGPVESSDTLYVGDSVTYGTAYIPDAETFPALLGGVNGGVNGWGLQNVARFLASEDSSGFKRVVWVIPSCDVLRPFTTLREGLISTNRRMWLRLEYLFRFLWYGLLHVQPAPDIVEEFEPNVEAVLKTHDVLNARNTELVLVFLPSREEAAGEQTLQAPYAAELAARAVRHGIRSLHVSPPAGDVARFYRDTAHLTVEGNRWLADFIRASLADQKTTKPEA